MTTTVYQDGTRSIEIKSSYGDGYRIELPLTKGGVYTIQEMWEGVPNYEISVAHDEIDKLINGLLDAKREYRNMYE